MIHNPCTWFSTDGASHRVYVNTPPLVGSCWVHLGAPENFRVRMALLDTTTANVSESDGAANRVFPVTVKLTQEEHRQVTEQANRLGQARSEWMREVILRAVESGPASDPSLAEIVGVRLLLVNVLRPVAAGEAVSNETFDKLLDEIANVKYQLAEKLAANGRK